MPWRSDPPAFRVSGRPESGDLRPRDGEGDGDGNERSPTGKDRHHNPVEEGTRLMPATADNLRDLHLLHQRAKALRDRLAPAPRRCRHAGGPGHAGRPSWRRPRRHFRTARFSSRNTNIRSRASTPRSTTSRSSSTRSRKTKSTRPSRTRSPTITPRSRKSRRRSSWRYDAIETKAAELKKVEDEVKRTAAEVAAFQKQLDEQVVAHKAQLQELETAIVEAEAVIPDEYREKLPPHRRPIRGRCPGGLRECLVPSAASPR